MLSENLREQVYKNTMEMVSLNQLLDNAKREFEDAHNGDRPDFAKLSIISSKMAILFHKMETVFVEHERLQKEIEKELFE